MKEKKRISMTILQDLAKKIEKEFGFDDIPGIKWTGGEKLRQIIILHFDSLGHEIYYDK